MLYWFCNYPFQHPLVIMGALSAFVLLALVKPRAARALVWLTPYYLMKILSVLCTMLLQVLNLIVLIVIALGIWFQNCISVTGTALLPFVPTHEEAKNSAIYQFFWFGNATLAPTETLSENETFFQVCALFPFS